MDRCIVTCGLLLTFLGLVAGCGPDTSTLTQVSGIIKYNGVPLQRGTIVFTPDTLKGSDGPMSRAEIQPDGTYVLRTNEALGAMPGWHRVTIVALEEPGPSEQESAAPRSLLPFRYRDPEQSGLSCQVRTGQENVVNFDLE